MATLAVPATTSALIGQQDGSTLGCRAVMEPKTGTSWLARWIYARMLWPYQRSSGYAEATRPREDLVSKPMPPLVDVRK